MKVLEVGYLSKKVKKKVLLDNISVYLCSGEIVGLIGNNGVGKSTLFKVVLGLQKYNVGNIKINGFDLKDDFVNAIKGVSGIIEYPDMYGYLSGYENLLLIKRLHKDVTKKDIDRVVKIVNLEKDIHLKVYKYSLGMKQRLGLACSLLSKPNVLLLDEPTNGLDPVSILEFRSILLKLADDGIGVLISSHNLTELSKVCNRVYFMDDGRIVKEIDMNKIDNLENIYLNVLGGINDKFDK